MSAVDSPTPWSLGVVVPANDEVELIGRSLDSILHSLEVTVRLGVAARSDIAVVVVTDSCADDTAAAAEAVLGSSGSGFRSSVMALSVRNVGTARRAGVAAALDLLGDVDQRRCWLANTDADTRVPGTWLLRHLREADAGAVAVAGVVEVDSFADHAPGVGRRFTTAYGVHRPGPHPHVHGANLGVRADAYLAAGGWGDDALAEDHGLWNRVAALGVPMVSTTRSRVVTSGRSVGRAPGGFADTLTAFGR